MEVYVDVIFIENTIIDLFLLLLTTKLLKLRYRAINLYIAAIIGGVYTFSIFLNCGVLIYLITKVAVAVIMVGITIKDRAFIKIAKGTVILFLLSFLLGGICFGIVESKEMYYITDSLELKNYSIKWIVFAILILYIVIARISDHIKDNAVVKNFIYDVYISVGNETVQLKGFLDTGNELREPVTNLPCIIIEEQYLRKFNIDNDKKYIISYKTISSSNFLYGFKGDSIKIKNENENEWHEVNAIVCGCKVKLSRENDFHALLSRGVL